MEKGKYEVGTNVWDSISRLGVVSRQDKEGNISMVEKMERRDKEAAKAKELIKKSP